MSDSEAGSLIAFKNISTISQCETPNRPYLKGCDAATKTVFYIQPDCKQWSCEYCANRRAHQWRYKAAFGGDTLLKQGRNLMFVTLTSHELIATLVPGLRVWRSAWPKLSAKMRRKQKNMQYLSVPELTKAGRFHVHLITTSELETSWYKDNARKAGLGYMAKAKPVISGAGCGHYVTKYLTKAIALVGWPKNTRRINKSQGWPIAEEPDPLLDWTALGDDLVILRYSMQVYEDLGWKISHKLDLSEQWTH